MICNSLLTIKRLLFPSKHFRSLYTFSFLTLVTRYLWFVAREKREKHPWRSVTFSNFTKSNTPPWVFFTCLNYTIGTKSRNASQTSNVLITEAVYLVFIIAFKLKSISRRCIFQCRFLFSDSILPSGHFLQFNDNAATIQGA